MQMDAPLAHDSHSLNGCTCFFLIALLCRPAWLGFAQPTSFKIWTYNRLRCFVSHPGESACCMRSWLALLRIQPEATACAVINTLRLAKLPEFTCADCSHT